MGSALLEKRAPAMIIMSVVDETISFSLPRLGPVISSKGLWIQVSYTLASFLQNSFTNVCQKRLSNSFLFPVVWLSS